MKSKFKIKTKMKAARRVAAWALLLALLLPGAIALSQTDNFFYINESEYRDGPTANTTGSWLGFGENTGGEATWEDFEEGNPLPTGGGLLVLALSGACYAGAKRLKSRKLKDKKMKRTLSFMVMALALLLTQCRKPEVKFPTPSSAEGVTVSMTVTAGPGSKTDITDAGVIKWSSGDKLYVGDGSECIGYLTLTSGADNPTGTFSGNVTLPTGTENGDKTFHFFYLGSDNNVAPTVGATSVNVFFNEQNIYNNGGKLENAKKFHIGYGTAQGTVAGNKVTGINVTLVSKVALARFSFTAGTSPYEGALTLSGTHIYNRMTVGFDGTFSGAKAYGGEINLTDLTSSEKYVMLVPPASVAEEELKFGGSVNEGTKTLTSGIEANKFYGKESAVEVPLLAHKTVNFGNPNLNWSVCNLGATNGSTPESWYGDYYAWGATTTWYEEGYAQEDPQAHWKSGYSDGYSWAHCPFTNGTYSSDNKNVFTKYVPTGKPEYWAGGGDPDNKLVLESSDDAAAANWGDGWRIPTVEEWEALKEDNTFEWLKAGATSTKVTSFRAVAAGVLVVKGGKHSIALDPKVYMFVPFAGSRDGTDLNNAGKYGDYWEPGVYLLNPSGSYYLSLADHSWGPRSWYLRYQGYTVRPVRDAQ